MKTLQQKEREYANTGCCEYCKYNIGIEHKKCDIGGNCDAYNSFIADFRAGYNAHQHETRWRSIEEELPECGSDFIAKMNKEHPFKDEVEFTSIHILYKRTSEIDADCLDKLQMDGCTHWKPIE